MFPYIPHTKEDMQKMLDYLQCKDVKDLFNDIPENIKLNGLLDINTSMSELEVEKKVKSLASQNKSTENFLNFLGAGCYDHYIPSIVKHLASRSEFYTAYTPYQAEISQGTLQVIFEYQTMIANLTGMDASNASIYDGATATAEAAMLSASKQKGDTVVISKTVHPEVRQVVKTYMKFKGYKVIEVNEKDYITDKNHLEQVVNKDTVCVIAQNPNFFGVIEDYSNYSQIAHDNKALFIMNVDPISLSILKSPGEYGADIAVGEGQVLGNAMNFGGPHLGFMAATKKMIRKIPGRIVGQTKDVNGNRAYVLTLQAREQHIKRERATSNICSNQALNALMATIYIATMGFSGLKDVSTQCINKSYYLYKNLIKLDKIKVVHNNPFFREFVIEVEMDIMQLNKRLLEKGFIGGYDISGAYPEKKNQLLLCVAEKRSKQEIDEFIGALEEILC